MEMGAAEEVLSVGSVVAHSAVGVRSSSEMRKARRAAGAMKTRDRGMEEEEEEE